LYVVDNTNFQVLPVDLDTRAVGNAWNLNKSSIAKIAYSRPKGNGMLVVDDGRVYNLDSPSSNPGTYSLDFYYGQATLASSLYGNRFCAIDSGISLYHIKCYGLDYSYLDGGVLTVSPASSRSGVGSNGADVAVNKDGSLVYAASGSPYSFIVYDANTMEHVQTLAGDAYPNNVEIDSHGLIYGGISSWYGPDDVWVYDSNGVELYRDYVSGYAENILTRQMVVSGDGNRMIILVSDPGLIFLTP
jgi:hypothetical protein